MANFCRYCLLACCPQVLCSSQRTERTATQWKESLVETSANLEGAPPVTPLCSAVGSPSQRLSDLASARAPGSLSAAWLLEAVPRGEAPGVQQELPDKATGTDSHMFRGCFQLSAGDCVHGGASSGGGTSAGPPASSCCSVVVEHRLVQALPWLCGHQEGWVSLR